MSYITVDFVKKHTRIDVEDEELMQQYIEAAEDLLKELLQVDSLAVFEENPIASGVEKANGRLLNYGGDAPLLNIDPTAERGALPARLRQALLMLAGTMYENRESLSPVQLHGNPYFASIVNLAKKYKG